MSHDSLGDRMKRYELVSQDNLMRRTPVIIRIDGKAFHTWTKCLKNFDSSLKDGPFSNRMHQFMTNTTKYLVENIQNAVFGYTQSDEISILLNDWKTLETAQWFDAKVQKMASVSASMATAVFNYEVYSYDSDLLFESSQKIAMFDARVFNLPKEEVVNYFIWRQKDASRNSVQMLGRFYFSHSELQNKNNSEIQDMLMLQKGVNWNDIEVWKKRGTCVYREEDLIDITTIGNENPRFIVHRRNVTNNEIPIFTQDREFIENFLK